jgi:hypothetical protein
VVAAGLSVLLVASAYWWFHLPLALLAVYALIAIVATLSVPVMYRLAGFMLADEVDWLEQREAAEHVELVARLSGLRSDLASLTIEEGVRQVATLTAILNDYHAVIETRFIGKKHSPMAYLSTARRVQKHAVQNLTDVVAVGHSLASISRLDVGETSADSSDSGADSERRQRLLALEQEQSARMEVLIAENRKLFDALTDTAVEVANIRSYSDYERLDTLARLVSLAEIASHSGK